MDPDRCPCCATDLVRIAIAAEGRTILMRSCTSCSRRWWTADGLPVDPTDILGRRSA
jgi:transcriptional regulator NrdR family protein